MSYIDKEEYEERYGEHVGYCSVHHITVLDTCQYCEDDNAVECTQCHFVDMDEKDFTWTSVDGELQLLCWACTDRIHTAESAKDARAASIINVDYLD